MLPSAKHWNEYFVYQKVCFGCKFIGLIPIATHWMLSTGWKEKEICLTAVPE